MSSQMLLMWRCAVEERPPRRKGIIRFLTLSGAMTIGQMSLVICDMIDRGMVHSITSTGALMAHGLVPGQ